MVIPSCPFLLIQRVIILVFMVGIRSGVAKGTKDTQVTAAVADGKALLGRFILACVASRQHLSGYKGRSGVKERSFKPFLPSAEEESVISSVIKGKI